MHLQQTLLYAPFLQYTTHGIENLKQRCAETFRYFWQETGAHLKSTHLRWLLLRVIPTISVYTRESLRVAHEGAEGSHDKFLVKGRRNEDCVAIVHSASLPLYTSNICPTSVFDSSSVSLLVLFHSHCTAGVNEWNDNVLEAGAVQRTVRRKVSPLFQVVPNEQMHPSSFAIVSDRGHYNGSFWCHTNALPGNEWRWSCVWVFCHNCSFFLLEVWQDRTSEQTVRGRMEAVADSWTCSLKTCHLIWMYS